MIRRRLLLTGLAASALCRVAAAQEASTSIIVPGLPNEAAGTALRVLQPFLESALGHSVFVDFRPGAGGMMGLMAGARAAADGSVLTMLSPALTLAPWLNARMDSVPSDFAALGRVSETPSLLIIGAAAPWRTLADLLRAARQGRALAVAQPYDWQPAQVAQAIFLSKLGLAHVGVSGTQSADQRIAQLVQGALDLTFVTATPDRLPAEVRVLAVAGRHRLPALPDTPTLIESGIDVARGDWRVLAVPSATPSAIRTGLEAILDQVFADPAAQAALAAEGVVPSWDNGAEADRTMSAEYRSAGRLFSKLGLNVRSSPQLALSD